MMHTYYSSYYIAVKIFRENIVSNCQSNVFKLKKCMHFQLKYNLHPWQPPMTSLTPKN